MNKVVLVHHRFPDGAECVFNKASGAYDLPVKKWRKRAKKEAKA